MTIGQHVGALLALGLLLSGNAHAEEADCDIADIAVATVPVPPQSATAYRRAEEVAARAAGMRDVDVVLLGDSLTQLWPEALARETFGSGALNLGVGSDRTQNVLWRIQDARYAKLSPRTVLLMIGTNNLGYGDKICAIRDGIQRIVGHIDTVWRRPRLVVVGILPRGKRSSFRDDERMQLNGELEALVRRRGKAVFIDLSLIHI